MARKRSRNARLIRLGALAFGVVLLAWLWREIGGGSGPAGTASRVIIPKGASLRVAADSLAA
ncbi:MAG: hypothetical protein ACK55A_06565, partial [Gemmatimonas sp.]